MSFLRSTYSLYTYYAIVSVLIFLYATKYPEYNWDVLGYVGSVKSFDISGKQELLDSVILEAEEGIPEANLNELLGRSSPDKYKNLTGKVQESELDTVSEYRRTVSSDPEAFYQQLPFYKIRILYVGFAAMLSKAGINTVTALSLISALSVIAGLWLLMFGFRPYVNTYLLYSVPLFGQALGYHDIAKLGSADSMAFFSVVLAAYLYLRKSRLLFIIFPLSVLVRTDLVIFAVIFLVYLSVTNRPWRYYSLGSLAFSIVAYFAVNEYFGNYGWLTVFYFTFVSPIAYPADMELGMTMSEFIKSYQVGVMSVFYDKSFLLYGAVTISSLYLVSKSRRKDFKSLGNLDPVLFIALASFLYIIAHFALYPSLWSRYFAGQYILSACVFLYLLSNADGESPA